MKPTKKIGPKHQLVNPMPRNLMLTEEVIDKARKIGKGNLSAGVRKAVSEHDDGNTLWCLHILGADDMYPAPDKPTAIAAAIFHNLIFDKRSTESGVMCKAEVKEWPYSAAGHAREAKNFVPNWFPIEELLLDATTARTSDDRP